MNFLAPSAFFLGLLLPIIIALYFLKLRRVEIQVSSNYLWKRMVRDVEANAPWQKLRPNLLLILQILFLTTLIIALTRPFSWAEGTGGQALILLIDSSASMSAVDVLPSRLESAKQRARQLIEELPDNARVTIIEAGQEARVLLSSSLDRRQAQLSIQTITPGTGTSDMTVALQLASAIAARQPGTEIVVLSDGNVTLPESMTVKGSLRYIPFGLDSENQAISLLTIEEDTTRDTLTAFIQVSNYGIEPSSPRLTIYADDMLVYSFDVENIPPSGQKSVIAEGLPWETQQVEAIIQSNENLNQQAGQDMFALDDSAYIVKTQKKPAFITLVTGGNRFIRTALSLLPGVQITEQISEDRGKESPAIDQTPSPTPSIPLEYTNIGNSNSHLTIYDYIIPDQIEQTGSLLFIAPPNSTDYFTVSGLVQNPRARVVNTSDLLIQNVSFSEVNILDAVYVPLPQWATPVVISDSPEGDIPLIFYGETEGRKIVVISFDIRHSDMPLQVAFPLLWSNIISWLTSETSTQIPSQIQASETLKIIAPEKAQVARFTLPDQKNIDVPVRDQQITFSETSQLGFYNIRFLDSFGIQLDDDEAISFAVNLFSPQESNIQPADNLVGLSTTSDMGSTNPNQARHEWWRYLALLSFGLLVGEWVVYHRAAISRIRDWLRTGLLVRWQSRN